MTRKAPVHRADVTSSILGGRLNERRGALKLPRRFDGTEVREVRVRVMKYYGVGVHYHVSLEEEDDAFLVTIPKRPTGADKRFHKPGDRFYWRPHDMPHAMHGRARSEKFDTPEQATAFIDATLVEWGVTPQTHSIAWDDYTEEVNATTNRWYYRDGD